MDYFGKEEMLTNRDVNKFVHKLREISFFVRMEHFRDLLYQLMKYGTNTFHVAPIFLFSVNVCTTIVSHDQLSDSPSPDQYLHVTQDYITEDVQDSIINRIITSTVALLKRVSISSSKLSYISAYLSVLSCVI